MNSNKQNIEIVLWKDKEWSIIDADPCRVFSFHPLGSLVDINDQVISMDKTTPYASIHLECKKLGNNITGYITHKVDFKNLWAAFKTRGVKEDEEVLVFWTKKHYKKFVFSSIFMPKLWVMICPKGAYNLLINPDVKPNLGGKPMIVVDWKPEVMD